MPQRLTEAGGRSWSTMTPPAGRHRRLHASPGARRGTGRHHCQYPFAGASPTDAEKI